MQMNQVRILAGPEILSHTRTRRDDDCAVVFHMLEEERVRDLTLRGVAAHCSQSALWDASLRERVTLGRLSEQVTQQHSH